MAEEIEVTPEMVEAGVNALSRLDREWTPSAQIVTEVFEAMAQGASHRPLLAEGGNIFRCEPPDLPVPASMRLQQPKLT